MKIITHKYRTVNISEFERWASAIGGSLLVFYGIKQRFWPGLALAAPGGYLIYRGVTGHCGVFQALGIHTARRDGKNVSVPYELGIRIDEAVTINRPLENVYRFWRNFENLPRFMRHLASVTVLDRKRSHWLVRGLGGACLKWDAEVINEKENELIAWRSLEGSQVDSGGSVHFERAPAGQGTVVKVEMQYNPPAGVVGALIASLFGNDPERQIREDLRRLKQLLETEDVVEEASEESFPASDAPAWSYGVAGFKSKAPDQTV